MKKKEIGLLIFFFIVSTIYSYQKPQQEINSMELRKEIIIQVEGRVNMKCIFDHKPTVKEVLGKIKVQNIYNFKEDLVLSMGDTLYIPPGKDLISLNMATKEELMGIEGLGITRVQKIIDYRHRRLFTRIEDLLLVKGIGEKIYLKIRPYFKL